MSYDATLAGRIRKLLGTRTDVVEKKMFGWAPLDMVYEPCAAA